MQVIASSITTFKCAVVASIGAVLLLVALYGSNNPPAVLRIMASTELTGDSRHTSGIPIKITICSLQGTGVSTAPTSLLLCVTLENTSDKSLSLLSWSSPFDSHASAIGVFSFTSKSMGEHVPSMDLKINRKIPDNGVFSTDDENIITIKAGEKVQRKVEVKKNELPLEKGTTYIVKARGRWMGVWLGDGTELSMNKGSEMRVGGFESAGFEVVV